METEDEGSTVVSMLAAGRSYVRAHLFLVLIAAGTIFAASVVLTLIFPRQYVATMVVAPVESSYVDPGSLMFNSPLSLRGAFSFNGPGPQMGAFIKLLKTPQVARCLESDRAGMKAMVAIRKPGWLSNLLGTTRGPPTTEQILAWLTSNVSVQEDLDLRAWTLELRAKDGDQAKLLLSTVRTCDENILRGASITQLARERDAVYGQLSSATLPEDRRKILYEILSSLERSLLVLQSGADIASSVISQPYVPEHPTSPSRALLLIEFIIAFSILTIAGWLLWLFIERKRNAG